MSGTPTTPHPDPDGHGTHGGGLAGPGTVSSSGGVSGPVSNNTQLILDHSVFTHLPKQHLNAIRIVQLEYARDVSARATAAYDKILGVLREQGNPPTQELG